MKKSKAILVIPSAEYVPYNGKPRPTEEEVRRDIAALLRAAGVLPCTP